MRQFTNKCVTYLWQNTFGCLHQQIFALLSTLREAQYWWDDWITGLQPYCIENGKNGYSAIILEAKCDYICWFWHAEIGFPGKLNNLNVLNLSHLINSLLDGTFVEKEVESNCVLYKINIETFLFYSGWTTLSTQCGPALWSLCGNLQQHGKQWQKEEHSYLCGTIARLINSSKH